MKITPQCIPCILNVRLGEILKSNLSEEEKIKAQKKLIKEYTRTINKGESTVKIATLAFRKVKKLTKDKDPYFDFKKKSYEASEALAKKLRREIKKLKGYKKFRTIMLASVYANFLDPGAPLGIGPEEILKKIHEKKVARDESRELYDYLTKVNDVTFILDNAGEAIIDLIFVEELTNFNVKLKIIAKGKPYQNDTTYEEAKKLGFGKYGKLISTNSDSVGLIGGMVPQKVLDIINSSDLIIAKGMANFESFTYERPKVPTFSLLVAKCEPVAKAANVKPGDAAMFFVVKPKFQKK
ncbi:MAG: ARMT1-like domain-containing protein [Thermoproteota archaeon]